MPGLTPFQPDEIYCVYCHKKAAGQCAFCHAWVCGECTILISGLSRPLAICKACSKKSPRAGRQLLLWLIPIMVLLGLVAVLVLALAE